MLLRTALLATLVTLTACGGGNSESSPAPAARVQQSADAAVSSGLAGVALGHLNGSDDSALGLAGLRQVGAAARIQSGDAFMIGSTTKAGSGKAPTLSTYLDQYLSRRVRDDDAAGCPVVIAACDTGRQSEAVSQSYTAGFVELRDGLRAVLDPAGDNPAKATLAVAALIGAMAISRGVVKTDAALADEVLAQVRAEIERLAASG